MRSQAASEMPLQQLGFGHPSNAMRREMRMMSLMARQLLAAASGGDRWPVPIGFYEVNWGGWVASSGSYYSVGQNNCKSPIDLTLRKKPPRGALQLAQKLSKQNLKGQVERTSPQASSRRFLQRTLWQTIFVP
jgi:hypothetical protein